MRSFSSLVSFTILANTAIGGESKDISADFFPVERSDKYQCDLLQAQTLFRETLMEINNTGFQTRTVRKLQLALGMTLPLVGESPEAKSLIPKIYASLGISYAYRGQFKRATKTLREGMAYARASSNRGDVVVLEGGLRQVDRIKREYEPLPPSPPLLLQSDIDLDDPSEIRKIIDANPDRYEPYLFLTVALVTKKASAEVALEAAKRVDVLAPPESDPGLPFDIAFDDVFGMTLFTTAVQRAENGQAGPIEIRMLQRSLGMAEAYHRDAGVLDNLYSWLAAVQFSAGLHQTAGASALTGLREAERSGDEKTIEQLNQILSRIQSLSTGKRP